MSSVNEKLPKVYYQCQPEETEVLQYSDLEGFSMGAALDRLTGSPTLEVAGPTSDGFPIIANRIPSKPYITNIFIYSTDSETTDLIGDFKQLPIKSGVIGMVLASCIPMTVMSIDHELDPRGTRERSFAAYSTYAALGGLVSKKVLEKNQRIKVIEESARVLQPEGLLVWQGGHAGDIEVADMNGLNLVRYGKKTGYIEFPDGEQVPSESFQCVFQKS